MKLYGSLTSPYVRKCRILIKEKNLPVEFVIAGPSDPGSPVPGLNPLGKVPVLGLDSGETLFDSPVIVEYLDSLKAPALLAASGEARWETLRWQALADGMLDATVLRLTELRRPPEHQSADTVRNQEGKIARSLEYADRRMNGAWIMQQKFTLADIVLGVALEYLDLRYPHDWRGRHPNLARWHAQIDKRPAFVETVPPGMEKK